MITTKSEDIWRKPLASLSGTNRCWESASAVVVAHLAGKQTDRSSNPLRLTIIFLRKFWFIHNNVKWLCTPTISFC